MAVSAIKSCQGPAPNGRFILEGIPAVLVGILIFFFLPDYPETAKFLSEEERQIAMERMGPFAPKGTDKHFDKKDFVRTITAWQFWAFACVTILVEQDGADVQTLLFLHDKLVERSVVFPATLLSNPHAFPRGMAPVGSWTLRPPSCDAAIDQSIPDSQLLATLPRPSSPTSASRDVSGIFCT